MEKTVAAISSAIGESGIGIVRMTGSKSFEIAKKVFRNFKYEEIIDIKNRTLQYGFIVEEDITIDEVLIVFMQNPRTYTKEDMVEIYCHGGTIAVKKVLNLLLKKGAFLAERGEFTKRAFLNGRLDLSQAEAVIDLIDAKTDKSYEASLNQLKGGLKNKVKEIKDNLLDMLARVEFSINFMEDLKEDLPIEPLLDKGKFILSRISDLVNSSNKGRILKDGIKTVIIGKPNVGKSSLLNALLNENRAIVTDVPGTTRDTIEEYIDLGGVSIKIVDTAGIRNTDDLVESIGVTKSIELAQDSDLIIAIFDISKPFDDEDKQIMELINEKKSIILLNKHDLAIKADKEYIYNNYKKYNIIDTSIYNNQGIKDLEKTILDMFFDGEIKLNDNTVVTSLRHKNLLEKSYEAIDSSLKDMQNGFPMDAIEIDLKNAYTWLGEITGETIDDDVLDKIFSDFCIGK